MRLSKSATVSLEGDRTVLLNRWPGLMRAKTDYTDGRHSCQALGQRLWALDNHAINPPLTDLDGMATRTAQLLDVARSVAIDLHPALLDEPPRLRRRYAGACLRHRGRQELP